MIDVSKNSVKGKWTLENHVLTSPNEKYARIQLPCSLPDEYDLQLSIERKSKPTSSFAGGFYVGLVSSGKQFGVELDGGCTKARLFLIDGKYTGIPGAEYDGKLFVENKPSVVVYSVRRNKVEVSVDGKRVIDWTADYSKVSPWPEWKVTDGKALSIGAFEADYTIKKANLTPLGSGKQPR